MAESQGQFTKHGDLMKLHPKGASSMTAAQDNLQVKGVLASQELVKTDLRELNRRTKSYYKAANKYGIQPSLIAALASRESRGGSLLERTDGWGDRQRDGSYRAYGILQGDVFTSGIGRDRLTSVPWDSYEHIDMLVGKVLMDKIRKIKAKHPTWRPEQKLQGGVAAYNSGENNVQSWEGIDVGSTGNDYSNDVIARAQYLVKYDGWD